MQKRENTFNQQYWNRKEGLKEKDIKGEKREKGNERERECRNV